MTQEPDLRSLRIFRSIVALGSVTAAAREFGLSQPTVSRMLTGLERQIGFDLFHRDRGRLVPTTDALLYLEQVDHALGGIDRAVELARDITGNRIGRLKLVAPPSFAEGVLPDIVAAFLDRFPAVHVTLDARSVETAKAMIASREVDAGFVKRPVGRPDLRETLVARSPCACLLPSCHPLAERTSLDPRALSGVPLVLLGSGRSSRHQIEGAFAGAGVRPKVRVEAHTIGSAAALALRGVGVAIVNERLARSYLRPGLVCLPFSPPVVQEYAYCTALSSPPTRLADAFLALTLESLRDET